MYQRPDLQYNLALCCYKLRQYSQALKHLAEVVEAGVRQHPELSVGRCARCLQSVWLARCLGACCTQCTRALLLLQPANHGRARRMQSPAAARRPARRSQQEGVEARSVGNSQVLRDSALVEAFNLKAAIELSLKNAAGAADALADMPPRCVGMRVDVACACMCVWHLYHFALLHCHSRPLMLQLTLASRRAESELDPVSLHNAALVAAGTDPSSAFQRLNFLIASGSFPREAFANLLLLYCAPQHGFWDLAGDVMAEHPDYVANLLGKVFARCAGGYLACLAAVHATHPVRIGVDAIAATAQHPVCASLLTQELRELLSCLVSRHRAPEAALDALDALAGRHVGRLRGLTKALQDARSSRSSEAIRVAIQQYDEALEHYIPGARIARVCCCASSLWKQCNADSSAHARARTSHAHYCVKHPASQCCLHPHRPCTPPPQC